MKTWPSGNYTVWPDQTCSKASRRLKQLTRRRPRDPSAGLLGHPAPHKLQGLQRPAAMSEELNLFFGYREVTAAETGLRLCPPTSPSYRDAALMAAAFTFTAMDPYLPI